MTKHYCLRIVINDYADIVDEDTGIGLYNNVYNTTGTISESGVVAVDSVDYLVKYSPCRIAYDTEYVDATIVDFQYSELDEKWFVYFDKYRTGMENMLSGSTITCNSAIYLSINTSLKTVRSRWTDGILENIGDINKSLRKYKAGYIQNEDNVNITLSNITKIWDTIRNIRQDDSGNGTFSIAGACGEIWYYKLTSSIVVDTEKIVYVGKFDQPQYTAYEYECTLKSFTNRNKSNGADKSYVFGKGVRVEGTPIPQGNDIEPLKPADIPCFTRYMSDTYSLASSGKFPVLAIEYNNVTDKTKLVLIIGAKCTVNASQYEAATTFLYENYCIASVTDNGYDASYQISNTTISMQVVGNYTTMTVYANGDMTKDVIIIGAESKDDYCTYYSFIPKTNILYEDKYIGLTSIDETKEIKTTSEKTISSFGFGVDSNGQLTLNRNYFLWLGGEAIVRYPEKFTFSERAPKHSPANYQSYTNYLTSYNFTIDDTQLKYANPLSTFIAGLGVTGSDVNYTTASYLSTDSITNKNKNDGTKARFVRDTTVTLNETVYGILHYLPTTRKKYSKNIHIGVRVVVTTPINATLIIKAAPVYYQNVYDRSQDITEYTLELGTDLNPTAGYTFDNIPDEYWGETGGLKPLSLVVDTGISDLRTVEKIALFVGVKYGVNNCTIDVDLRETCLILDNAYDIDETIYPVVYGTQYGSGEWSRAVTSSDVISLPSDVIEYAIRNMSWIDISPDSYTAKILTSGYGAFNDSKILALSDIMKLSGVSDSGSTQSDIIDDICGECGLIVFENSEGYLGITENYPTAAIVENLTISEFINVSDIKIEEQDVLNIYCEPRIKYDYDPASKTYQHEMSVTNTDKETFQESYVTGNILTSEKERLWLLCRSLYLRAGIVREMPKDLSELKYGNHETGKHDYALRYLQLFIRGMFEKTVVFNISEEKAMAYEEGQVITVKAANQTNDTAISAMITGISYNTVVGMSAQIRAVLLDEIPEDIVVFDNYTATTQWQDTYNTGTEYQDI